MFISVGMIVSQRLKYILIVLERFCYPNSVQTNNYFVAARRHQSLHGQLSLHQMSQRLHRFCRIKEWPMMACTSDFVFFARLLLT
jgi:hypothetical protein